MKSRKVRLNQEQIKLLFIFEALPQLIRSDVVWIAGKQRTTKKRNTSREP